MNTKRTPAEMFGEFLREASVLVLVFGIIISDKPLTLWRFLYILLLVSVVLSLGIWFEVRRK